MKKQSGNPMVMVLGNIAQAPEQLEMEGIWHHARDLTRKAGILVYTDMKRAFRAISRVVDYYRRRRKMIGDGTETFPRSLQHGEFTLRSGDEDYKH